MAVFAPGTTLLRVKCQGWCQVSGNRSILKPSSNPAHSDISVDYFRCAWIRPRQRRSVSNRLSEAVLSFLRLPRTICFRPPLLYRSSVLEVMMFFRPAVLVVEATTCPAIRLPVGRERLGCSHFDWPSVHVRGQLCRIPSCAL